MIIVIVIFLPLLIVMLKMGGDPDGKTTLCGYCRKQLISKDNYICHLCDEKRKNILKDPLSNIKTYYKDNCSEEWDYDLDQKTASWDDPPPPIGINEMEKFLERILHIINGLLHYVYVIYKRIERWHLNTKM